MKFGTTFAVVALISVVGIAGAQGKTGHKMPMTKTMGIDDWQLMYSQAAKQFDAKNADAIFGYMTPDFTMTMNGKTQNAAGAKAGMKTWFAMMKTLHCSMKVVKANGGATTATVVDNFNNWGMTMPDPKTHKSAKFVDTGTETATWVKKNGKWMMQKLVTSNEKMTMDGKPVKQGM